MEIRVLRYFLEIAREGNMSRAAERLHVTQPTLSKQMKDLEQELGKKLFKRGSTSVSLTDEGMLLRKRAEDLLALADKITNEFQAMDDITGGDIYIGCAESYLVKYLARAVKKLSSIYPNIHYHVTAKAYCRSYKPQYAFAFMKLLCYTILINHSTVSGE